MYKRPMDKDNRGKIECGRWGWGWIGQKRVMVGKWGKFKMRDYKP